MPLPQRPLRPGGRPGSKAPEPGRLVRPLTGPEGGRRGGRPAPLTGLPRPEAGPRPASPAVRPRPAPVPARPAAPAFSRPGATGSPRAPGAFLGASRAASGAGSRAATRGLRRGGDGESRRGGTGRRSEEFHELPAAPRKNKNLPFIIGGCAAGLLVIGFLAMQGGEPEVRSRPKAEAPKKRERPPVPAEAIRLVEEGKRLAVAAISRARDVEQRYKAAGRPLDKATKEQLLGEFRQAKDDLARARQTIEQGQELALNTVGEDVDVNAGGTDAKRCEQMLKSIGYAIRELNE